MEATARTAGLNPQGGVQGVRQGGVGGHKAELTPDILAKLDARWRELVTPVTGFADYAALEAALRAE